MEYRIPATDKEEIVYALVDEDDYNRCIEINWHLSNGYVVNTEYGRIHRFILGAKKGDPLIDHIDGNPLNNKKSNIIFSTSSQNAQNRPKLENTTSQYIGVSLSHGKWMTALNCNNIHYTKVFDLEIHAAYYYDILAIRHHGPNARINGVLKPEYFIEPEKIERILPKGIILRNNYQVCIKHNKNCFYLGTFETLEKAMEVYNKKHKEIEEEERLKILNTEIQRNSLGQAVIYVSRKDITKECIVDEAIYYDLKKFTWDLTSYGYARGYYKGKRFLMHRYVMREELSIIEEEIEDNEDESEDEEHDNIIDHIDRNKLNNCKNNLRLSTHSLNSHNRTSIGEYKGVSLIKKNGTYKVEITINKNNTHLGVYKNKIDAARAYDRRAKEVYGSSALLNLPEEDNSNFEFSIKTPANKYKGVSKNYNKYAANIAINGVNYYLGGYDNEEKAALAYNNAITSHGLKRKLNVIPI